jgi:hypothetical protein
VEGLRVFYTVDSSRRTYGELWRIHAPNLIRFLIAALKKVLGVPQRHSFAIRRPAVLTIHATADVPRPVRQQLAPAIRACEDLGLALQFYASIDALTGGRAKAYLAALLDVDRQSWATVMTVLIRGAHSDRVQPSKFNCFSLLPDRTYVVTTDHVWKLTPHPGDWVEYLVGEPPEVIVAAHRLRLRKLDGKPVSVGEEALAEAILLREQRHVDHQIERGVYVPLTGEELEGILRKE